MADDHGTSGWPPPASSTDGSAESDQGLAGDVGGSWPSDSGGAPEDLAENGCAQCVLEARPQELGAHGVLAVSAAAEGDASAAASRSAASAS